MKNLALKTIVKLHDRKIQRDIKRDEEGLTMLAYALGAAVIIVPLANYSTRRERRPLLLPSASPEGSRTA